MRHALNPLTALVILIATFATVQVYAHENLPITRSAIAQIHSDRVEILLIYSEPPGVRSDALLARYDINGNAKIDGKETMLALPEISKRMVLGLRFEVEGEKPQMRSPELKIKKDRSGGLSFALYLIYDLKSLNPNDSRSLSVTVGPESGTLPLKLIVEAADGLSIVEADMPHEGNETRPVEMSPGTDYSVRVAQPQPSQ